MLAPVVPANRLYLKDNISLSVDRRTPITYPQGFQDALLFAVTHHGNQLRKGTAIPYLTHPVIVAETLAYYYPDDPELILAGLLHDVLEDTHGTAAVIRERFGGRVAELVEAVSKPLSSGAEGTATEGTSSEHDKVQKWRSKRLAMLQRLDAAPAGALKLKAADALANLRAIQRDLVNPDVGETVWQRFKVGRADSLWYYREILQRMERLGDDPLVKELAQVLAQVEGVNATGGPVATT